MKTVLVIYDGAADGPQDDLNGRTPLQVARCPHAAALAKKGAVGMLAYQDCNSPVPHEVTLATLLGVPESVAQELARGPLETASLGYPESTDICYRGEFVTLDGEWVCEGNMKHLTAEETASLSRCLQQEWDQSDMQFVPMGPGYMNVQVGNHEQDMDPGVPPFLAEGAKATAFLPSQRKAGVINRVFEKSAAILSRQTVNDVRLDLGENPASAVWLWGGGRLSEMTRILGEYPVTGGMLTQSAMAHGLANLCGLASIDIMESGNWSKAKAAFRVADVVLALRQFDLLTVYIEGPCKQGQIGSATEKVRALEAVDKYLMGPLLSILDAHGPYRIMMVSDWSLTSERDIFSYQLPYLMVGDGMRQDEADQWDEQQCSQDSAGVISIPDVLAQIREGI